MLIYFMELRRRILSIFAVFFIAFMIYFWKANELFQFVIMPLLKTLPLQSELIATSITSPLFIPLKLAANAALFTVAPLVLYHIWQFAHSALYRNERIYLFFLTGISLLLFCLGGLFCFYIVLPFMLQFFVNALPDGVRLLPEMASSVDFITRMILVFGFSFEIPLLCLFVVRMGICGVDALKTIRPYVIVAAFTLGMLLTPPDVFSQVILAVPLCILYELGLLLSVIMDKIDLKRINSLD